MANPIPIGLFVRKACRLIGWQMPLKAVDNPVQKTATANAANDCIIYVPPFDHHDIWRGAGTMIDEIVKQLPRHNGQPVSAARTRTFFASLLGRLVG
jgi:threonine dehydratase